MRRGALMTVAVGAVLAAVVVWCGWAVMSVGALRHEVEDNVGTLTRLGRIRAAVEAGTPPDWREARDRLTRLRGHMTAAGQPALQQLIAEVGAAADGGPPPPLDEIHASIDRMVAAIRARNGAASETLGKRWDNLYGVILIVIVLSAALLVMTQLIARRSRQVAAGAAALQARNVSLQRAARQWVEGDLDTRVEPHGAEPDEFEIALDELRQALAHKHHETLELADDLRRQVRHKSDQLAELLRTSAPPPAPGVVVDQRFELVEQLGQGGMATVFRARHLGDGKQLAIKMMRRPDDETGRRRFLREAWLLADVHHPNVLRILDVGVHGNEMFLVTELIDGVHLGDLAALPCQRALAILRRVAGGLAAIHARGIVHRDLKLSNILIGGPESSPTVKIADFGIARPTAALAPADPGEDDPPEDSTTDTAEMDGSPPTEPARRNLVLDVTAGKAVAGTLRYMAPECRRGEVTAATDVFAFGVVAFRILYGRFPWQRPPIRIVESHGRLLAPEVPDAPVPEATRDLVLACLDADPAGRPRAELLAATL